MVIAIISDTHDNIPNLKKCLNWCLSHEVEKIFFCGDITTEETLYLLAKKFRGEIFLTNGNADLFDAKKITNLKNVNYQAEVGLIKIGDMRIGFCHEPQKIKRVLSLSPVPPHFIFYGHTHTPWIEKQGSVNIINPGNLAGTFHQATFAVLDTSNKKLELKILADL